MDDITTEAADLRVRDSQRPGITPEHLVDYYNNWSCYDEDAHETMYNGPEFVAEALTRCIPPEDRAGACVLDVAAGTGLVGLQLKKRGFLNIHGLDPADKMLQRAQQKNCYCNFICDFLGGERCPIPDDAYDAVVSTGAMTEGHIPCAGIVHMLRITKPGGFVVISMREEYLHEVKEYSGRLEMLLDKLEMTGAWHKKERLVEPDYYYGLNGVSFVYQVTGTGAPPVII